MKVISLKDDRLYSSYAYLLLGNWNRLEDVNTLVDVGATGFVLESIAKINTGVGKIPVEQVILTHGHFDHAGGLPAVKARYNPRIFAYTQINGGSEKLKDGEALRAGDQELEVIHIPVHSQDSICLYGEREGVLFSGDTPLRIMTPGGTYPASFLTALERLVKLEINRIYAGHDGLIENAAAVIKHTLNNVQRSILIDG
jgi:glyoxylase-like metal-dependent hydrolase (beta-lactamase superfamily II)